MDNAIDPPVAWSASSIDSEAAQNYIDRLVEWQEADSSVHYPFTQQQQHQLNRYIEKHPELVPASSVPATPVVARGGGALPLRSTSPSRSHSQPQSQPLPSLLLFQQQQQQDLVSAAVSAGPTTPSRSRHRHPIDGSVSVRGSVAASEITLPSQATYPAGWNPHQRRAVEQLWASGAHRALYLQQQQQQQQQLQQVQQHRQQPLLLHGVGAGGSAQGAGIDLIDIGQGANTLLAPEPPQVPAGGFFYSHSGGDVATRSQHYRPQQEPAFLVSRPPAPRQFTQTAPSADADAISSACSRELGPDRGRAVLVRALSNHDDSGGGDGGEGEGGEGEKGDSDGGHSAASSQHTIQSPPTSSGIAAPQPQQALPPSSPEAAIAGLRAEHAAAIARIRYHGNERLLAELDAHRLCLRIQILVASATAAAAAVGAAAETTSLPGVDVVDESGGASLLVVNHGGLGDDVRQARVQSQTHSRQGQGQQRAAPVPQASRSGEADSRPAPVVGNRGKRTRGHHHQAAGGNGGKKDGGGT